MSYCRFSNTLGDLRDCYEHWEDDDLSEEEKKARVKLLKICRDIVSDFDTDPEREAS